MAKEESKKRKRPVGYNRKHDRYKFQKTTNAPIQRKDLGNGRRGFLVSTIPRHEDRCYHDAVLMLGKLCDVEAQENKPKTMEDELADIRSEKNKLFTRVQVGANAAVFLEVNDESIDLEKVVEKALREARSTGNSGSRHCIRLLPVHTTCYAKPEDATKEVPNIVKKHFPKIDNNTVTYAIAFRSRLNNGAKREDFIHAIAGAVEQTEPRYKVNLSKPDVVLLVEVFKTSCCIGTFRYFYELAKMNLREAACPSAPKANEQEKKQDDESQKGGGSKDGLPEKESEAKPARDSLTLDKPENNDATSTPQPAQEIPVPTEGDVEKRNEGAEVPHAGKENDNVASIATQPKDKPSTDATTVQCEPSKNKK